MGERSPYPLDAKPLSSAEKPSRPFATTSSTAPAAMPATTCVTMYPGVSFHEIRPLAAAPRVTAGLKWPPEMWPTAYAITTTVSPKARATPSQPTPTSELVVARTAVPQPPKTRTKVPRNSAVSFLLVLGVVAKTSSWSPRREWPNHLGVWR